MITGEIKNKIDKIWTDIWAGGITNPLTVIEQLTYLMFIRSLDEKELEIEQFEAVSGEKMRKIFPQDEEGQSMRWSRFKTMDSRKMYDIVSNKVFPFIKNLNGDSESAFSRYMQDAMFLIPTPQLLQKIVTGLDELYEHDLKDRDMQGDVYEYMLSKLSTAGQNGQFRTPKHIRDMMVQLVDPKPDEKICDPACGTAGFLVSAAEYIRDKYGAEMTGEQWERFSGDMFTGFDIDRTMLRISAMNLMLHSITQPNINYVDSVSKQNTISAQYDVILANPPFTGTIDAESINDDLKAVCEMRVHCP
jgi:type I restriction enzyme M protein